jgi:hypothetical protein
LFTKKIFPLPKPLTPNDIPNTQEIYMSTTVKLGQLFLLRRDLKQEIGSLTADATSLIAYREDKEDVSGEYLAVASALSEARNLLHLYDRLIEQENAKPNTVAYKGSGFSLNEARHYKVHLLGELNYTENLVRVAVQYSKKADREQIYEPIDVNNSASQVVAKVVEKKYKVVTDIKLLKDKTKEIKQNVQLLDSLIQQADWLAEVEIP